jgi:hypothetical protein
MRTHHWLGGVTVLVLVVPLLARPHGGAAQPPQLTNPSGSGALFAGRASCSARSCHGSVDAEPGVEGAYTVWLRDDSHARAYETLLGERSRRIARNLGDGKRAHEDKRCLACHGTPGMEPALAPAEGVGCEACHGAANGLKAWLYAHTDHSWNRKSASSYGMADLSNAQTQAQVCSGCHVGAAPRDGLPARDVDHDLIAAGHPRLAFEFTVYRANLRPHWSPQRREPPDAWPVGRLVAADASLKLLAYRAGLKNGPWPEFTEYDCFACHADLRPDSWRAQRDYYRDRVPGSLPRNVWYTTGLRTLGIPPAKVLDLSRSLGAVWPKKEAVQTKAKALLETIEELLQSPPPKHPEILARLVPTEAKPEVMTWDQMMQLALAVEALAPSDDDRGHKMKRLRSLLAFPPRCDSPGHLRRDKELDRALNDLLLSWQR